ncbi:MAG: hypothetical protein ACR2JV_06390 [Gaiellales bacterium]
MPRRLLITLILVLTAFGVAVSSASATQRTPQRSGPQGAGFYDSWKWFKDTYWIVPPSGVYSVLHSANTNTFQVIRGQTVFHITDYFNGYWTGSVVVKITRAQVPSCQTVLGQVTPDGHVFMTMYDATTGLVRNNPVGMMVKVKRQWTMVNQMTSAAGSDGTSTLSHWAYMVQSKEGDRSYARLPFSGQSIPDFMSSCPPGPMINRP